MENKFFSSCAIDDRTTIITGLAGENCILFEGEHHALLFDSLTGAGSLKAYVRELTDLPVIPVLSHAHPDHEGGFFEYGACCMHPDDIPLLYSDFSAGLERRLEFVNTEVPYAPPHRTKARHEDMIPPCAIRTYPVYEGRVFDLGGRQLEVIHVPGHTRGSIVLLEKELHSLYTADAINPNTLLHLPNGTTVEEYKESAEHLKTYQPLFDRVYTGHSAEAIPASVVDDAVFVCERILAGEDAAIPEEGFGGSYYRAMEVTPEFRPAYGGYSNICYRKDRVHGKSMPYPDHIEVL